MKLTTLLLIITMLHVSASSFAQRITLSKKNVVLTEVLDQIRIQTGYDFIFNNSILKNAKKVNIAVKNAELAEVLEQVFADQPLQYKINENKSVVITKKDMSVVAKIMDFFSAIDVRGKVVDEQGEPLPGASVKVKGGSIGAVTDRDGEFFLKGLPEDAVIVIVYLGYKPLELKASASMGIMKLEQVSSELKEIVINKGYYTTTKTLNTGSVSKLTAAEIERQPVTNPLQALQGRVTGISITQESGIPGSNFQVRIRGTNSIQNGNEPLYIIDGVPFISEVLSSNQGLYGTYFIHGTTTGAKGASPLNSINPNDIESIEILKDADATAIYGSRGANGVVLITTKKGKAGATKFDVNVKSGISQVIRKLDVMNTQQYIAMRMKAVANDQDNTPGVREYDINGTWDQNRYTDWQEVLIGGTAGMTDMNASISAGNNETQFLFSAGYNDQGTVYPGDDKARKFSTHFSVVHTSQNKKFKTNLSTSYILNTSNFLSQDLTYAALALAPNAPALYSSDGSLNWENSTWENPLAQTLNRFTSKTYNLLTNAEVGYEIAKGFGFKVNLGLNDIRSADQSTLLSSATKPSENRTPADSYLNTGAGSSQSWIIEPQANWDMKISKGKLAVLAGGTYQNRVNERTLLNYMGFASNALVDDPNSAAALVYKYNTYSQYKYAALYGRINYNWDERYVINITGRRDASSRFGPGKKIANLGAAGVAWIFSNETLVKHNVPVLSFGKIRASHGLTGNDQIGDYAYLDTYRSAYQYQGIGTLGPDRLYNPKYGWEVNKKLEGAVELGFLNDRILLTTAWYRNSSSNQLINYQLAGTTGYASVLQNSPATVQNTGLEMELTTTNISRRALTWSTSVNFTVPKNKLLSFPNIESSSYANTYIVGKPLNITKVYRYLGVNSSTGLYEVEDVNGDGQYTPEDKVSYYIQGENFYGGINNSFTFKGIQADILFQFVSQKGQLSYLEYGGGELSFNNGIGNRPASASQGRWEKSGDNAIKQYFSRADDAAAALNRFITSDALTGDSYYIRLKNVSLSYQLPNRLLKGIKGRFYLQGQNLLTFTDYKGLDPESGISSLPPLTTVVAGIQLTF